jgi:predicted ferric reductase
MAIGALTGLIAALAVLGAIVLTARPRFLERRYGLDHLLALHRWFGIVTVFAVIAHSVIDTWAWGAAKGTNIIAALIDLLQYERWMVAALVASMLLFIIGISSWRRIRTAMSYETWYFLHLLAYLAVLLGFGHQLTLGTDFVSDRFATWWWIALAVAAVSLIAYARVAVIISSLARRFYVRGTLWEADNIGSLYVAGPGLKRLHAASGQYFMIRAMTRDLWWQAHPYSLSAAPTDHGMRFTVKQFGADSARLLCLAPGTRLLLEGPYGAFTVDQAEGRPVMLVAGGAGIAPIRAILEDCQASQSPVVIVRVSKESQVAHRGELEELVAARGGRLLIIAGPRAWFAKSDPFQVDALRDEIPDIASREVFVCGPSALESAVISGIRKAGVPSTRIHLERFGV